MFYDYFIKIVLVNMNKDDVYNYDCVKIYRIYNNSKF